ncbi:hypothetical protein ABZ370_37870 [Streptomyces sp. NPDC005962]|uniref:hypothetical protein n=1 Tax=Streptomyces sp. NPDC005962 TaxID=3154466 RepID=UPI0033F5CB85
MTGHDQLRAEDVPDFERVVRRALRSPDAARAIQKSTGDITTEQLLAQALRASDDITAAAAAEYRAYLRLRTDRPGSPAVREPVEGAGTGRGRGVLAALGVLVPGLASMAAAIFLALGYVLRFIHSLPRLADELIVAGWIAAVVAAVSTLAGLSWMLAAAARNRPTTRHGHPPGDAEKVARARDAWQRALLERGVLPFLETRLRQPQPAHGPGHAAPELRR